jgi:hypothetical protein
MAAWKPLLKGPILVLCLVPPVSELCPVSEIPNPARPFEDVSKGFVAGFPTGASLSIAAIPSVPSPPGGILLTAGASSHPEGDAPAASVSWVDDICSEVFGARFAVGSYNETARIEAGCAFGAGGGIVRLPNRFAVVLSLGLCAWVGGICLGQEPAKGRPKKAEAEPKLNPAVDNELEVQFGAEHVSTHRLGVKIKALGGAVRDAYGTLQIPTPWPEQTVRIIKEDKSPAVRRDQYRETGLLKQFIFHMPVIEPGQEELVQLTLEYVRKDVLLPDDTSAFLIPKKLSKELRIYLGDSPKLDPKAARVTQALKEIFGEIEETATDWDKLEAIYNFVKDNITRHMMPAATTADVLKNKKANGEDAIATLVALYRAARAPARMVWLSEGVSAEFYLVDESGKGRWFPCSFGAENQFGFSTEAKPIMLKGDSFRVPADAFQVPEQKGEQRNVFESLKCASGGKPQVDFIRQLTAATPVAAPGAEPASSLSPSEKPEEKPGEAFIPLPGSGDRVPPASPLIPPVMPALPKGNPPKE